MKKLLPVDTGQEESVHSCLRRVLTELATLMPPISEEQRDRLVFYPVAVAGGVFCVTVLMTIAAAFGDPQAPVSRWLNRNATSLLLWETALLGIISVLAMVIDRVRTMKKKRHSPASPPPESEPSDS